MFTCSQATSLRETSENIAAAKTKISDILNKGILRDDEDCDRLQYFMHALRVFQTEFLAQRKAWNDLALVVEV